MSQIKSKDTKPEMIVRSTLHKSGYRFRLHRKDLPGKPDIILPKYRTVIFIHGCFWHRHKGCKYCYKPKSNIEKWQKKFEGNIARDEKVQSELREMEWKVIVIWECEVKSGKYIENLKEYGFIIVQ